jgi:hypothetical protein
MEIELYLYYAESKNLGLKEANKFVEYHRKKLLSVIEIKELVEEKVLEIVDTITAEIDYNYRATVYVRKYCKENTSES